ncbi:MAG TPA: fibronectin type III domain-containing protein [Candidatus Nitrosotalea sp.]|nr:fibronectin type III domain-containing protein [Candidatus Nitrosotalea sp.]
MPNSTTATGASTTVDGVQVFGNGTIITSVNGVSTSFLFDPNGPAKTAKGSGTSATVTVKSDDMSGNTITGIWNELHSPSGSTLAKGYTTNTYQVTTGKQYVVYMSNYQNIVFDHWDDGSTNPYRTITPTQSVTLTAYYTTGSTSTAPQPPTNLSASAVSSTQINLNWSAPSNNGGSAIIGYKIERSTDGGTTWNTIVANIGSTVTTYSDSSVLTNTTYSYRVSAINSIGTSQPSNVASATTGNTGMSHTVVQTQSGLVASDSLINETRTQQQLQSNTGYWAYAGDAPAEKAPYSFSRDTQGLHIGMQAPSSGTWAGFFAESPNTNAVLFHSIVTTPVRTIPNQDYENGMYVQTANGLINYVTCVSLTNSQDTVWAIINTYGTTDHATKFTVLWMDNAPNQSLTRDCSIITNGQNYLKVYMDGNMVYSNNNLNLQMPAPFNTYLEPETSYAGQFLIGSFQDYYVTSDETIKVTNNPSNAARADIVDSSGSVLASSQISGGIATLDVAKYHFPLAANIKVYDSNNSLIASGAANIYSGDIYSIQ